jgi:DcmR-like sensory protein
LRSYDEQLQLYVWDDIFFQEECFRQDAMLAALQKIFEAGQGNPLTRCFAQMEWALEDRPGVEDLLEYESRFNYIMPRYRDVVICAYDLTKFGADVVIDVMRTHPVILIGGILQENPFFVPPDQFLRELRERDTRQKGVGGATQ